MPALVSILIPCHNAAPWLAATLDSALAQSWPYREIIVVDDGSSDRSLAIAQDYRSEEVKIVAQRRRGASAARNVALALARGDFIQFLDADDLLAPDKIALQIVDAIETEGDFAFCGMWSRFTHSPADADFCSQPLCADLPPVDWLVLKLEQNRMMHPAAWLLPRTVVAAAGSWNESLSLDDDGEYFTRAVLASKGVRCCRDAISYYRSSVPHSLSSAKSEPAWESAWRAKELSTQHLLHAEDSPRTRRAAAAALQRFIYESYPHVPRLRTEAAKRVRAYGGTRLTPEGGPLFQLARTFLGWRLARRLQLWRKSDLSTT